VGAHPHQGPGPLSGGGDWKYTACFAQPLHTGSLSTSKKRLWDGEVEKIKP